MISLFLRENERRDQELSKIRAGNEELREQMRIRQEEHQRKMNEAKERIENMKPLGKFYLIIL
jgi:hypothetical protein